MTWVFIAWSALYVVWIVVAGWGAFILGLIPWLIGFVVLWMVWMMTRSRSR